MAARPECRILIIEDSPDLQLLMRKLLDSEGYETLTAANGAEALALLETLEPLPRALVLDLMMPGMDGFEFRNEQRKRPRIADIPVLVLTAGRISADDAERLGACDFQSKPIDIEVLLKVLARICHHDTGVTSHET